MEKVEMNVKLDEETKETLENVIEYLKKVQELLSENVQTVKKLQLKDGVKNCFYIFYEKNLPKSVFSELSS